MSTENPHTVTVTTQLDDEGTEDERRRVESVSFACTAPPDGDCRRHPECGCEVWSWDETGERDQEGHPRIPGHECWLKDWFENEGTSYTGDDFDDMRDDCVPAIDRSGPITACFTEEYVEWDFEQLVSPREGTQQP